MDNGTSKDIKEKRQWDNGTSNDIKEKGQRDKQWYKRKGAMEPPMI